MGQGWRGHWKEELCRMCVSFLEGRWGLSKSSETWKLSLRSLERGSSIRRQDRWLELGGGRSPARCVGRRIDQWQTFLRLSSRVKGRVCGLEARVRLALNCVKSQNKASRPTGVLECLLVFVLFQLSCPQAFIKSRHTEAGDLLGSV